jgi:hypothetical protein
MQLDPYQMQIALSLIVILGAALVALLCDLLKGNNEQLRELALELRVRCEEQNKRFQMLAPHALAAPAGNTAPKNEEAVAAGRPVVSAALKRSDRREKRTIAPEALAAMQRGEQLASSPRPRRVPDQVPAEPVVKVPVVEVMQTAEVMEVMQAAEAKPAPPPMAVKTMAVKTMVAKQPAGLSRDWGSVLNAGRQSMKQSKPADTVIATAESVEVGQALPAGFQDGFVLTRLVESRQPVSGLVVSIGVSTAQDAHCSLPADVRALIQSLIGPDDFAVQSGKSEFLLIYPGERGASSHRRLTQIAEQLWDFQLRSLGVLSILFSWGGVEVRDESIDEAIASATERMEETRRNRRVLTMEPRADAPLRRAV